MRVSGIRGLVVAGVALVLLAGGSSTAIADSWSVVKSPSQTAGVALNSVTCVASADCWAAGGSPQPLIEQWNGSKWKTVPAPGVAGDQSTLNGVTCSSASSCWAAGADSTTDLPILERWDGTSWTSAAPAPAPDGNGEFLAITCMPDGDCWAVGDQQTGSGPAPLIESWDGTTWSVVPSPVPHDSGSLHGVFCRPNGRCWAVGYDYDSTTEATQPLIEKWNGQAWKPTVIQLPGSTTGGTFNAFNSMSCLSTRNCWAVGYNAAFVDVAPVNPDIYTDIYTAVIEHWNGHKWSAADGTGTANGLLTGVICPSESDCTAVGSLEPFGEPAQPLIESGPTGGWAQVPSGVSATAGAWLNGDWCSTTGCWAVGGDGQVGGTVIERDGTP